MAGYMVEFDPSTIARLRALISAAPIFSLYYASAMASTVQVVRTYASLYAPVRAIGGGGTLRRGIIGRVITPLSGEVGVGYEVPYARRREYGFTGMTDALGRYYREDPGSFYLKRGLEASLPYISATWYTAAKLGVNRIAAIA